MHTATQPNPTRARQIICKGATDTAPIVVHILMMIVCGLCLAAVLYGIYRYIQNWTLARDERVRPPIYIHAVGLIFFVISCLTLCNTLLYDVFYLVCQELAAYESSIYHTVYFCQIYTLWLVLFLRIYYVFHGGMFALSKPVIYAYTAAFIVVPITCIPMFVLFGLAAQDHIKLPFVIVSVCFCTSLLVTFLRKLWHVLVTTGVDDALIRTTTKNVLLALISICGTLVVVLVLLVRFVYDRGYVMQHEVWEELVLECAILIDISTNFLCVLLAYKSFDKQYRKICGGLDRKFTGCFKKQLDRRMMIQCHSPNVEDTEKTSTVSPDTDKSKSRAHKTVVMETVDGMENEQEIPVERDEEEVAKMDAHAVSVPVIKLHSNSLKLQRLNTNPVLEKRESLIHGDSVYPQ